jgi:hypothetical protein
MRLGEKRDWERKIRAGDDTRLGDEIGLGERNPVGGMK